MELFPKDAYDVPGEVFTGLVGEVGEAVEPHGAGEEVGAREGDLDGPISALGGEFKLVEGERPASAEFAVNDWVANLSGWHVEGAQLLFELVGVVDHSGEVGEWDELAVVEEAAYETGVAVAALLSVGYHVDTGTKLGVDGESGGVVSGGLEVPFI